MDSALRVSLCDPTPLPTALFGPVHISPLFWAIVPAMARQNHHGCPRPATFFASAAQVRQAARLTRYRLPSPIRAAHRLASGAALLEPGMTLR